MLTFKNSRVLKVSDKHFEGFKCEHLKIREFGMWTFKNFEVLDMPYAPFEVLDIKSLKNSACLMLGPLQ